MKRIQRLVLCSLVLAGVCSSAVPANGKDSPNILFILIDDMGWMDLACQGNPLVKTPHIDRLASQGMRFTDAYSAAPVCSPTRAALMTGLAPARLHITNHIPDQKRFTPKNAQLLPAPMFNYLPLKYETVAERLGAVGGYSTAFLGKWHLCGDWTTKDGGAGDSRYHPEEQGFKINIGGNARGGPSTFFDPYNIHKLPDRKEGEYLPDRLADEAIAIMKRKSDKPFYLALWNYTVHWPMEAPDDLLKKYAPLKGKPGLNDTRYGAMIEAMDSAIGRVLAALDELELADDTLVVFTSDNGGYSGVADNRPLRSGKGYLYEGGIRVPLIVRWPGMIKPGTVSSEPVISTDFYPTLLEVAGVKPSGPSDGLSLVPLFKGGKSLDRKSIYFHAPNYAFHQGNRLGGAIRQGDYKLIERFEDGGLELYDLSKDLSEETNLAAVMWDRAKAMRDDLASWRKEVGANMPLPATAAK